MNRMKFISRPSIFGVDAIDSNERNETRGSSLRVVHQEVV